MPVSASRARVLLQGVLACLVLAYLAGGVLLYVMQRDLLYLPSPSLAHTYPVERFPSAEQSIEVVVVNPGARDAVIYFGGNAEAVALNAPDFARVLDGQTVYLVNYRGYAASSGTPTEQGLYADAQAVYDGVRRRHAGISVVGRSLGAAVATFLAATREIDRLVLATPFDSLEQLAADLYPLYPVALLLKDRFDSLARVPSIRAPTLVLLAQDDRIVPPRHSLRLVNAFPAGQVHVATFPDVGHNSISSAPEYYPRMARFLAGGPGN